MQRNIEFSPQSLHLFGRTGRQGPKSILVGAWLLSSAVIAASAVCLPLLTATSQAGVDAAPRYSVFLKATTSNSALKGDRLDRFPAGTKIGETQVPAQRSPLNGGNQIGSTSARGVFQPASVTERKAPIGCETAFGKFAGSPNLSRRCVTEVDHHEKGAQASINHQA